ncbi:MAG: asparagine synthase (glutamine-hydrolyzing) [Kyrpidia tusciae]|nr:asparagine synthase (glutamine-hydrolyzing) [Kyrpidia tusciae]MBE3551597.1 asparagine synthase (glutamine-hydrolyzing) [Kyrpidia tusciae]
MCGICGIANRDGNVEMETLRQMAERIVHRGPDDEGFYLGSGVGFGFRRLSIIDVAGGHQPMSNEDGSIWVVFNGEIYNYKWLRRELVERGHQFRTDTDTEVLVHLYEEEGLDLVGRLRGMFAFAIWDEPRRTLLLARDHFGIKPLYYTLTPEGLVFASEIKSLLAVPGIEARVKPESLWNYLTFQYVPDPETMFEGIKKLPPAHRLIWREGEAKLGRYWEATFEPADRPLPAFVDEVREVLRESVRAHMNSDVPRGAFLSSGVDSSTIVALLKELEQVKTFTVGFEGAGGMSEIEYARETARILGTDHRDVVISANRYAEVLPDLAYHQDEPVADPSAIALYFVAELASSDVAVVLSGEGADELFGGYTIYREPLSLRMFHFLPDGVRRGLGEWARGLPSGMKGRGFLLRGSRLLSDRFVGNANIFSDNEKRAFLKWTPDGGFAGVKVVTEPLYERFADMDEVTQMQLVDIHTWLPGDILMKADKMTMANSLELRVPFLDVRVFDVARRIPTSLRLLEGTTKYVLREAVRDILPEAVTRRKKLGFPVPTRRWLRDELYEWARDRLSDKSVDEYFDRAWLLARLEDHRLGRGDYARKLWTVLMFLLWHDIYISGHVAVQPTVRPGVLRRRERLFGRGAAQGQRLESYAP